jgi:hypothetical protein
MVALMAAAAAADDPYLQQQQQPVLAQGNGYGVKRSSPSS